MIRDRGNIKWTAMMLPEHVKMLRDWQDENEKVENPQLNELDLTLMADEIERAYRGKNFIKLTFLQNGYLKNDTGEIIKIDVSDKSLVLENPFATTRYKFGEIVVATIID